MPTPAFSRCSACRAEKTISWRRLTAPRSITGWDDLVATVRDILVSERGKAGIMQINGADLDPRLNPRDHSDHLMTAKAAYEAAASLACVRRVSYVDYASMNLPPNLDAEDRDMESSVYAVTLAGVLAYDHGASWRHYDGSSSPELLPGGRTRVWLPWRRYRDCRRQALSGAERNRPIRRTFAASHLFVLCWPRMSRRCGLCARSIATISALASFQSARLKEPPMRYAEVLTQQTRRVISVDALRGFNFFWILGGDGAIWALANRAR